MKLHNPFYVPTKDVARIAQKLDVYFRANPGVPFIEAADLAAILGADNPSARELATRRIFEEVAERLSARIED